MFARSSKAQPASKRQREAQAALELDRQIDGLLESHMPGEEEEEEEEEEGDVVEGEEEEVAEVDDLLTSEDEEED